MFHVGSTTSRVNQKVSRNTWFFKQASTRRTQSVVSLVKQASHDMCLDDLVDSVPTQLVNSDVQFAICEDISIVFSSFFLQKKFSTERVTEHST